MNMQILIWLIIITLGGAISYIMLVAGEHIACIIRQQIPYVPSTHRLRRAVITEIQTHYADMHTACDIGAGYGGLARQISKKCNFLTVAVENMPIAALISCLGDIITGVHNKTVWCDAFNYIDCCDGFDIGVLYLGPGVNDKMLQYTHKFRVLISVVAPINGIEPTRVITLPRGHTWYGVQKYPHKLFVYELNCVKPKVI